MARDHLLDSPTTYQYVVEATVQILSPDSDRTGRIRLGIAVHEEHRMASRSKTGGKVDRSCGLPNAAFLVGNRDDLGQFAKTI